MSLLRNSLAQTLLIDVNGNNGTQFAPVIVKNDMQKVECFITHKFVDENKAIKGADIRRLVFAYIQDSYPDFTDQSYISYLEFDKIRKSYLLHIVAMEEDDISLAQQQVVDAITGNKIMSEDVEPMIENQLTVGQRAADNIAEFGGSWKFIISFFSILIAWIILNVIFLSKQPFDPYPFILLNLILSCLAAIQAPIIMMSQNRVEQKDRLRGENDYKINLKAELEIKMIHEKIDHLTFIQNKRMLEIQQMQIDYLDDILDQLQIKRDRKSCDES